ncbi:MAG: cysteine synthase A [Eubacteriales bacterium]
MNILTLIGNTPLVRLEKTEKKLQNKVKIFAKLEFTNPFGSIKDRSAKQIIFDAEEQGILSKKSTVIEASSGNMGVALAGISAYLGYGCTVIMPQNMAENKKRLIQSYGANLLLTDKELGMSGAVKKAEEISRNELNIYYPRQFENYSSVKAHKNTTAKEIFEQTDKKVDIVIAGIGTGGTISGIGQFLKNQDKNIKIIGVEPALSPFISQNRTGKHKIEGIGAGFLPKILDLSVIDEILTATDEESFAFCDYLAKKEGIFAGFSSGAVFSACMKIAQKDENEGKNIVLIFADSGERYI